MLYESKKLFAVFASMALATAAIILLTLKPYLESGERPLFGLAILLGIVGGLGALATVPDQRKYWVLVICLGAVGAVTTGATFADARLTYCNSDERKPEAYKDVYFTVGMNPQEEWYCISPDYKQLLEDRETVTEDEIGETQVPPFANPKGWQKNRRTNPYPEVPARLR